MSSSYCLPLRAMVLTLLILGSFHRAALAQTDSDLIGERIQYYRPQILTPPKAVELTGDFGRCPDPNQPCFKDNKDVLNGQRQMLRIEDLGLNVAYTTVNGAHTNTNTLSTSDSTVTRNLGTLLTEFRAGVSGTANRARLFDSPDDLFVNAGCSDADRACRIQVGDNSLAEVLLAAPKWITGIAADFTGDGYDEIFYVTGQSAFVLSAVDPATPAKFVRFGPSTDDSSSLRLNGAITAGRFRGVREVAVLSQPQKDGAPQPGLILTLLAVNPKTLAVSVTASQALPAGSEVISSASLAAGHFSAVDHDQLAVVYAAGGNEYLFGIDFDSQGAIVTKPQTQVAEHPGSVLIRSGRFDWRGQFDQLAFLFSFADHSQGFGVSLLGFDSDMNVVGANIWTYDSNPQCVYDLQIGNFDRTQADPSNPGKTIHDPNLQIAIASGMSSCGPDGVKVGIWNVAANGPGKWKLTPDISTSVVPTIDFQGNPASSLESVSLAAVDLQARSLVLGEPTIVIITDKTQPSVILAAPPMHVDYITPIQANSPTIFNFTAAPGGFFSSYQTSDMSSAEKTTTNKTSWSFAAQETLSQNVTVGSCELGDCIKVDAKESAKQSLDGSTATLSGTFDKDSSEISVATGFADSLWYSSSTLTTYVYPVIGKRVCPAAKPACSDQEQVQETVQFAGPDTITSGTADGLAKTWYQPAWMPGNILSYPGNIEQLKADTFSDPSNFQLLSDPHQWFTDSSAATAQATWTLGNKSGNTSSFNQNYSFETQLSFTVKVGLTGLDSGSAGASLNLSGSYGLSNLTNSATTLTKSTGIGFTKKAAFANPGEYGYYITPYIFGQTASGGVADNQPLSTDLQTFGILQTGHVVDPLSSGAGAFWTSWYTQAIDIGLSQPSRWIVAAGAANPNDGSCLVFNNVASSFDCATPGDKTPNNPWFDEFHWMRGFFITKTSPSGGKGGPQLAQAIAGDQLLLRTRVYNFSLTSMAEGSTVHVRFHGIPWDTTNNTAAGPSFLIGEQTASGQIPPFNTDTAYPNWVFASQTFDTTPYANQTLIFWVVVWAQDTQGNLIRDLPHHGLKSIPPTNATYAEAIAYEENYGNNIGLYHQSFYVAPSNSAQSTDDLGIGLPAEIAWVGSSGSEVPLGQPIIIGAKLHVGRAGSPSGINLDFYDSQVGDTPKIFASEYLSYLEPNKTYDVKVRFRSSEAGVHRIRIVAGKGTQLEQEVELRPIAVKRTWNKGSRD